MNSLKIKMDDIVAVERGCAKRHIYKISWKMLDMCPCSCSYCYMSKAVEKARKSEDEPTQEAVERIASCIDPLLKEVAEENDYVQLHLIGGEPSMLDLKAVISRIEDKRLRSVILATNLYRPLEWWQDLEEYLRERRISISLPASFHLEMLGTKEKRDEYAGKVIALGAQCKAVVNNGNIREYLPYFERFMAENIEVEITLEREEYNSCTALTRENQEIVDRIRRYQFDLRAKRGCSPYYIVTLKDGRKIDYSSNIALINSIEERHLDPEGFICTAGMRNVRINKKGEMLRSACRLCSMYFKLGNILDGNYRKITEPIICKTTEAGKDHVYRTKYCTCFNNTNMYRPGYDRKTGTYNPDAPVVIPDYHKERYGGGI